MNRRGLAILCVLIGTILFGTACGFVYMDQRQIQVLSMYARLNAAPGEEQRRQLEANSYIRRAMVIGPLGAGVLLAGVALVLFELPWFRRGGARG